MFIFRKKNNERCNIKTMTDDQLRELYEKRRIEWLNNGFSGTGDITYDMRKISEEMNLKAGERAKNDPNRNRTLNYHWSDGNRWEKD